MYDPKDRNRQEMLNITSALQQNVTDEMNARVGFFLQVNRENFLFGRLSTTSATTLLINNSF